MAIEEHYHEVMELLDGMFLSIFRELRDKFSKDIKAIREQFPSDEFTWREGPEGTLKLTFVQAHELLVEDGIVREPLEDIEFVILRKKKVLLSTYDLLISTKSERRLGELVKAKYGTDYFIVDKFPLELRPFYTMPDSSNPVSYLIVRIALQTLNWRNSSVTIQFI
jgi:aspartyl/asparaginyl-tRNA synthetase